MKFKKKQNKKKKNIRLGGRFLTPLLDNTI